MFNFIGKLLSERGLSSIPLIIVSILTLGLTQEVARASQGVNFNTGSTLPGLLRLAMVTMGFISTWFIINRIFLLLGQKIQKFQDRRDDSLKIGSREVIADAEIDKIIDNTLRFVKFAILAVFTLFYLYLALSYFSWTQTISAQVFSFVTTNFGQIFQGLIGYLPKLIFLVVLSFILYYLIKLVRFVFEEIEKGFISVPGFDPEWSVPTLRIASIALFFLFVIIAFPYLPGSGSDAFKGISIFLGILFSIGSSSLISNVIAGILLTYTRAFRQGDDVQIDGICGIIVDKGFLTTRVLDYDNRFVTIPNSKILNSNIVNFRSKPNPKDSQYPAPAVGIKVELPYDVDEDIAYQMLLEAAREISGVLENPEPKVFHTSLNNQGSVYLLKAYTNQPNLRFSSELRRLIQKKFKAAGLELSLRQHLVHHGDKIAKSDLSELILRTEREDN